jgi:hypothetical protein
MSQRSNEANKVENYLDLLEVRDQQSVPLKGTKLCVNSQGRNITTTTTTTTTTKSKSLKTHNRNIDK